MVRPDAMQQQMSALLAMTFKLINERGSAIIQLTAAGAGEGTTTVAYELARVAALSNWCKVSLIDAAPAWRGAPRPGGFDAPAGDEAELSLRPVQFGGASFAFGELNRTGDIGLQPDRIGKCCSWLRSNFTLVLVDCPPVLGSVDAANIAAIADGTILVIEAQKTGVTEVERARDLLLQAGGTLFGVILNKRPKWPGFIENLK